MGLAFLVTLVPLLVLGVHGEDNGTDHCPIILGKAVGGAG